MIEKVGTVKGTSQGVKLFQSKVGHGLSPTPLTKPETLLRGPLLGAIHDIQLNSDNACKMYPGKKYHLFVSPACNTTIETWTYTNMAPQASKKTCSRDRLYIQPNGPLTGSFLSVWNALFNATVAREEGHNAELG
jgi:hypothetical protein